jgi:peptidoglycan/LPS O-acetylase OafA/YrhL
MTGGFAGVDVFFVISGFLMTGIIFRGIEANNFSIIKFYTARAKRIIPALSALCLVVLIYSFFSLYDVEHKDTVNQAISALGFWSNFYFWETSSYFSAGSETKILLHTWSLSAEWQFYIIYPVLLFYYQK